MSNLLDKASIVTTPTAYDNGKILSVKPVQSLGSEKIVNGDFATNLNNWVAYSNTLISWESEGYALLNSDNNYWCKIKQSNVFEIGKTYKVILTAKSNRTDLNFHNSPITGSFSQADTFETFDQYYTATTTDFLFGYANAGSSTITIDNVSVKEVLDGDFQFTRNSSATRVSSQGLIEDVQILSSNLVSNGDFSQEGSEEVTNGDFSNGVNNWAQGSEVSSFTVTNGIATIQGNASSFNTRISQSISVTIGKTYKITGEIKSNDAGDYRVRLFNGSYLDITNGNNSEFQTFTYYHNATTSTAILYLSSYYSNGSADFSIDNVSVKEVGQDWTLGSGWSIGEDKAIATGASNSNLEQVGLTITNTKKYKISFTVDNYTSGAVRPMLGAVGAVAGTYVSENGTFTETLTANNNFDRIVFRTSGSGTSLSVSNISVIEITDDTNLPRIDYTGGEGHWLFEPQSTNVIPYSEDFSQWGLSNTTVSANSLISPNGTQNASKIVENNSNSNFQFFKNASVTNGTTYTISIFAKSSERYLQLKASTGFTSSYANFDLINGTLGTNGGNLTPRITDYGNDWYKCSVTYDATSTTNALFVWHIVNSSSASRGQAYQGDGLSGVFVWGAQVEASSYPTSYIPTNGSTVTRLADAATGSGSSDLINSTEGTLYLELNKVDRHTSVRFIGISDNTAYTNRVQMVSFANSDLFRLEFVVGGTSLSIDYTENENTFKKYAITYDINFIKLYVNGTKIGQVANTIGLPSANTFNSLDFGRNGGGNPFFGKTKCLAVWKEALTNDELECLTGEGYESFNALALANNYTII